MLFDLFKSKKFEPTPEEKSAALRVAAKFWYNKEFQKATKICEKYGISTTDMTRAALDYQRAQPLSVDTDEKASALRVALKYWNSGEYSKAMKICKKYGISDRDFSYAMVAQMNKK